MCSQKLDLHTLTIVLMALEGWHLLPPEKMDVFFHRVLTNQQFCSDKHYRWCEGKTMHQLERTMQGFVMRCVHSDIKLAELF